MNAWIMARDCGSRLWGAGAGSLWKQDDDPQLLGEVQKLMEYTVTYPEHRARLDVEGFPTSAKLASARCHDIDLPDTMDQRLIAAR